MALLERQLAKNGYQVVSWKVLSRKILTSEPIVAAKALGAQALLQINSLERSTVKSGQDARWDRRYFNSNSSGSLLTSVQLPPVKANQMDRYAAFGEKSLSRRMPVRLSATMNASVTYVETGEAIWFYDWSASEKSSKEFKSKSHLVCAGNNCSPYQKLAQQKRPSEEIRSGTSRAVSKKRNAEDEKASRYQKLLERVVKDLVGKFAK
jgi:hypothetical protein